MRHTFPGPRKRTHVHYGRCGHNSSPASRMSGREALLTHAGVTAIAVLEKDCLVSQSRHLLPSSRFAQIAKRNAQGGWLPIIAD